MKERESKPQSSIDDVKKMAEIESSDKASNSVEVESVTLSPVQIDELIADAVKKERARAKKESKEIAKVLTIPEAQIDVYLNKTSLTDRKFAERLIKSNVLAKYASVLRDEHKNITKISRIWDIIREKYRPLKK